MTDYRVGPIVGEFYYWCGGRGINDRVWCDVGWRIVDGLVSNTDDGYVGCSDQISWYVHVCVV